MSVKFCGGGRGLESKKGMRKEKKGDSKSCREIVNENISMYIYYMKYKKYIENNINQLPTDHQVMMVGSGNTSSLH